MKDFQTFQVVFLIIMVLIVLGFGAWDEWQKRRARKNYKPEDLYDPENDYKSSEKPFLSLAEMEREIKGTTKILGDDLKKRDLIIKRQKSIL